MRAIRRALLLLLCGIVLPLAVSLPPAVAQAPAQGAATAAAATNAKTWLGHNQEIEEYLKSAEVGKIDDISVGVTHPKRVRLVPGGPVEQIAFKPLKPGIYEGFWESYKAEIAAYELDKLLGLNMVPPTVEKRVKGDLGAAVMWISPTKSFKELGGVPTPPPAQIESWNRQLMRAKLFDDLIANKDPNLGNWLVDPAWNIILIDHSRCFITTKDLTHQLARIDGELWDRIKALTEETLTGALGQWLKKNEIHAILERRAKIQQVIDKLVADKGEAAVFVR